MPKFIYLDYKQNVAVAAAQKFAQLHCLYICPGYAAQKNLKTVFQNHTVLNNSVFLTMDEFKIRSFQPELPLIKEDKRTLAFYQCLCDLQLKDDLHIYDYFASLNLARNFFAFFEDIAQEYISPQQIENVLASRETQNQWQLHHYKLLQKLKNYYQQFLLKKGFTDRIFLWENKLPITRFSDKFQKIIVLNQFSISSLEKKLLPDDKTVFLLQIPASAYNEEKLCCQTDLSAAHFSNALTESIDCHLFSDEFSLKYFLFSQNLSKDDTIIDTGTLCAHLQNYHIPSQAAYKVDFSNSSLYKFITSIQLMTAQIIKRKNILLIPINAISSTISNYQFFSYFASRSPLPVLQHKKTWENLQNWLNYLYENSYKYLDLKLDLLKDSLPDDLNLVLTELFNYLKLFRNINNFQNFRHLLESEQINYFWTAIDKDELQYSNLPEIYSSQIIDFWTLNSAGIIDDWPKLLSPEDNSGYGLASALLKLLADFIKAKQFTWNLHNSDIQYPEIIKLANTQILSCQRIFILDAIEGNLPSSRKTPFLLTENQRTQLNLKTYQDIILTEKYLFLRLIANSRQVHILTRQQENDSTEISSFVEDIKLNLPRLYSQNSLPICYAHQQHIQFWLPAQNQTAMPPAIPHDFFALPFEPDIDLKDHHLILSPSNLQNLIEQPYNFYFDRILRLQEKTVQIEMDFTPLQQGNIMHTAFSRLWTRLLDVYNNQKVIYNFAYNQENYAQRALDSYLLATPEFILQRPHNHSDLFFNKIIKPFFVDAIIALLKEFETLFSNIPLTIIPESENSQNQRVKLFEFPDFSVILQGRADLRIEPQGKNKHIIDYKSGSQSNTKDNHYITQLNLYSHLYYPHQNPALSIYYVTDHHLKFYNPKSSDITDLLARLKNSITSLSENGFTLLPTNIDHNKEALTRSDLFLLQRTNNE